MYVNAEASEFALAGDAVFRANQIASKIPIGIYSDLVKARGAIDKLAERGGKVLPSHDPLVYSQYPEGVIGAYYQTIPRTFGRKAGLDGNRRGIGGGISSTF